MSEQARAWVSLIPTAKGFASKVQGEIGPDVEKAGKQAGKQYEKGASGGIGKVKAALAGAFVGGAAVSVLKGFIGDARESARIGKLTAQVIKTTGGAANVTADQVGNLATAISNKTGVDDEAVQSASNLLLTFTNVRNEVGKGNDIFNQATAAAVDMAAVLGGDARSQSVALGKALNDPIKGITALSRSGVSFTEQQKTQIKTMVKSGDVLGAQKIILAELGKEFGGAAAAASDPTQRLAVTMGNLKETIGAKLLPVVDKAAVFLDKKVIPALSKTAKFVGDNSTTFKILAGVVGAVTAAVLLYNGTVKTVTAITTAWTKVTMLLNGTLALNPVGLVVLAIAALVAGIVLAYKKSETFREIVQAVFKAVGTAVLKAVDIWLMGFQKLFEAMSKIPIIGDKFKGVAEKIQGVRDKVGGLQNGLDNLGKTKASPSVRLLGAGAVEEQLVRLERRITNIGGVQVRIPVARTGGAQARADGGPVVAGRPYLVGEHEPELFVPGQSGQILNQRQILAATAGGAGGGTTIEKLEQHIHNPLPERASDSGPRGLRRIGHVLGAA